MRPMIASGMLLVLAFLAPLIGHAAPPSSSCLSVAVGLDTSASMGSEWQVAKSAYRKLIDSFEACDRVVAFQFDATPQALANRVFQIGAIDEAKARLKDLVREVQPIGGDTRFAPVFSFVERNWPTIDTIMLLTDGTGDDRFPQPAARTVSLDPVGRTSLHVFGQSASPSSNASLALASKALQADNIDQLIAELRPPDSSPTTSGPSSSSETADEESTHSADAAGNTSGDDSTGITRGSGEQETNKASDTPTAPNRTAQDTPHTSDSPQSWPSPQRDDGDISPPTPPGSVPPHDPRGTNDVQTASLSPTRQGSMPGNASPSPDNDEAVAPDDAQPVGGDRHTNRSPSTSGEPAPSSSNLWVKTRDWLGNHWGWLAAAGAMGVLGLALKSVLSELTSVPPELQALDQSPEEATLFAEIDGPRRSGPSRHRLIPDVWQTIGGRDIDLPDVDAPVVSIKPQGEHLLFKPETSLEIDRERHEPGQTVRGNLHSRIKSDDLSIRFHLRGDH